MAAYKKCAKKVIKDCIATIYACLHSFILGRAILRGHGWAAIKGFFATLKNLPKKMHERKVIQSQKTVSTEYIFNMLSHDLPPNAYNLRKMRNWWWKLKGKA